MRLSEWAATAGKWCGWAESKRHSCEADFESGASTSSATLAWGAYTGEFGFPQQDIASPERAQSRPRGGGSLLLPFWRVGSRTLMAAGNDRPVLEMPLPAFCETELAPATR